MKNWEKCCPCFASFAFSSSSPSSPDPSVRRRHRRAARRRRTAAASPFASLPPLLLPYCICRYIQKKSHQEKLLASYRPKLAACSQPVSPITAIVGSSLYILSVGFCLYWRDPDSPKIVNNTLLLSVIYQTFKKDFSVKISDNYYHRFFYIDPKISF